MRHYAPISPKQSQRQRHARLFELHRQSSLQKSQDSGAPLLLPDVERMIKQRALTSLQPRRTRGPRTTG